MSAAGRPALSAHRRSLMTATAAGAVLCALWFVPSAKATQSVPDGAGRAVSAAGQGSLHGEVSGHAVGPYGGRHPAAHAADAGDDGLTSPFVLGSLGLAGTGAVLIFRARRRTASGGAG